MIKLNAKPRTHAILGKAEETPTLGMRYNFYFKAWKLTSTQSCMDCRLYMK